MGTTGFHPPMPAAAGARLRPVRSALYRASSFRPPRLHPVIRVVSVVLTILIFFSSSPALLALSAREAMMPGGGGKGSSANLLNAGAASAALTAAQATAVQHQTDTAVAAMKTLQARAHAIMAPAGTPNGLAAGWLAAYNPSRAVNGNNVPATWSGVSSLTQSGNTVTVTQKAQDAYLYWKNFSVGPQTTLAFDQSAGGKDVASWIAFNRVMGNVKTDIYGSITAQGQVYILNQNGILFHNGAQINTQALVASTLPINDNLAGNPLNGIAGRGIANNPDYQFLFSALPVAAGNNGPTAAFTPPAAPASGIGDVVVEPGASITAPANAEHTGGLVALIGPNVYNGGSINTPNGQTILAAGLQVGFSAHPSSDPSLRGFDVYIGQVSAPGVLTAAGSAGTAENSGYLGITEGDATIAGKTVNQFGVIDSSTSVSLNGRIDLLASYGATINDGYLLGGSAVLFQDTGVVDIGPASVMRILPEWNSSATVTGESLALNSVVSIIGSSVMMGAGAVLDTPGATATPGAVAETGAALANGVTIQAGTWFTSGNTSQLAYTAGQISLDPGAEIYAAGSTGIQVNSSQNFLTLQLRGAELADSPLQQNNDQVRGVNITIDTRIAGTYNGQYWIGTPLGDATGYAALIEETVGQLTEQGGSVSLSAGNSVVLYGGSSINTSGGWTQYSGGKFETTKLIYQGDIVDIANATPDRVYSGIYNGVDTETDSKWGVTKTYTSPLNPATAQYEAPYVQGANGGSITIQAPSAFLNGTLIGNTVTGPRQLRSSATLSTLPTSSSLTLNLYGQEVNNGIVDSVSPYAPSVVFASGGVTTPTSLALSPNLVSSDGFGNLTILNNDGSILLPANTALNAGVNGSVSLEAGSVTVQGSITAPGGSVSLTADLAPYSVINAVSLFDGLSPDKPLTDVVMNKSTGEVFAQVGASSGGMTTVVNSDGTTSSVPSDQLEHYQEGIVTVGQNAVISTAGLLVNDTLSSADRYQPVAINGGTITISGYQVNLKKGGLLDVSGGALLPASGSTSYGNAGTISISAGRDLQPGSLADIIGGSLRLGATLKGYAGTGEFGVSGGTAGTLAITAPAIQIGGGPLVPGVLNIPAEFFSQGGFGTFNLTGIGLPNPNPISESTAVLGLTDEYVPGIDIAPGTVIHPQVAASVITRSPQGLKMEPFTPQFPYGSAPNITLAASGLSDPNLPSGSQILVVGNLIMEEGSSITLDPQLKLSGSSAVASTGSIALSGNTVTIMGSITVPGGAISVTGGKTQSVENNEAPPAAVITVDLAPSAHLSTAGEALFAQDPLRLRGEIGAVLPGGSISVSGNILAEADSSLDASGARGIFNLFSYQLGAVSSTVAEQSLLASVTPYEIDSAGGSIVLKGAEELYSEATLVAASGGPTATGGSLTISSGRFYQSGETPLSTDLNLAVSQSEASIPSGFLYSGTAAIGQAVPLATASPGGGAPGGGIPEGGGHVAITSFAGGGFDNVTLGGNVIFHGPINLSIPGSLRVATGGSDSGGVLSADATVNLTASYVALGEPFLPPIASALASSTYVYGEGVYAPPTFGPGQLNVTAQLIDVGNLSLQNIGTASLNATLGGAAGAIRGDGTLDIAGNLVLRAAEIYPVTETDFTITAYNHDAKTGAALASGGVPGSITVERGGALTLPLSAGGTLSLYASSLSQGGNLVAPFGTINLGSDGTGTVPVDPVSGMVVPTSEHLELSPGSVTSISAVNPFTGIALSVPYGTSLDGTSWVDPSGTDITSLGLPGKSINISSVNLVAQSGSLVDLQGGGEETAYQWIDGNGGTINLLGSATGPWTASINYSAGALVSYKGNTWSARQASKGVTPSIGVDWTELPQEYAIVPGYQSAYAPTGYSDGLLSIGSQIRISAGAGLPAGTYTLLPASYASQPGAYLIRPGTYSSAFNSSAMSGSSTQPDGSVIVSGTEFNALNSAVTAPLTTSLFTLLSPSAIAARVQYKLLSADTFFAPLSYHTKPGDAGNLVFKAISSLALNGAVMGAGVNGGLGASIDISVPSAIEISQNGSGGTAGDVMLSADVLDSWTFGSLLIGGLRGATQNGQTPVTVTATSIALESGATLTGNDLILVANDGISVAQGSAIVASESGLTPDENLSVTGDGALLRISSDPLASDLRTGRDTATIAGFSIASGALLSGAGITLDSSGNASIGSGSILDGESVSIKAGAIAIDFSGAGESGALNLSGTALQSLDRVNHLDLTSYSTIDFTGSGVLGSASLASLSLHFGEIRGDNHSSDFIEAAKVLLDNADDSTDPSGGSPSATGGSLTIDGSVLILGSSAYSVGGFQSVTADLTGGVEGMATDFYSDGSSFPGTLAVGGDLTLRTPVLTGAASAITTIQSKGTLNLTSSGAAVVTPGLGASLTLKGASVDVAAPVELSSGSVTIEATQGDLTIASLIDVSGISSSYFDVTKYTDGGTVSLSAAHGNIVLADASILDLNAPSEAGSAGSLSVSAPEGTVTFGGSITAEAPNGTAGSFTATFGSLGAYSGTKFSTLEDELTADGFTQSQNIDVRNGDVTVGGVQTSSYTLTADNGSITVNGEINASDLNPGGTGGSITLEANGSVVLDAGSLLTVQGAAYDSAGKGGTVFLSAGNEINGQINPDALLDLKAGSTINLGVTAPATTIQDLGGTLHLRAPVVVDAAGDATGIQVGQLASSILGASSVALEGYMLYDITSDTADGGDMQASIPIIQGSIQGSQAVSSQITADINDFYVQNSLGAPGAAIALSKKLAQELAVANPGITKIFNMAPGVEIINRSGGLTLNNDWDLSTLRAGPNSAPGFLTLRASGNITFNASLSDGFQNSAYNAVLLNQNTLLPVNFQSWAYQITAGADFTSANPNDVLAGSAMNVALGVPYAGGGQNVDTLNPGSGGLTSEVLPGYYQVIRTGTGDISIAASGDLQFWNQFASIYTAGVQVTDPTLDGTFDVPNPVFFFQNNGSLNSYLGSPQQTPPYKAQFSYAGGDIHVNVGGDITQLTLDLNGNTIADSVAELPSNWLYRRGALASDGTFLQTTFPVGEVASTAWWVDFSNFFDDFGALGGGNITLNAAGNISNINASIPTNYRMPGHAKGSSIGIAPDAANGVELGGGDLIVKAGKNIDAGVYYVENGNGSLDAGGSIITNPTRDPDNPTVTGGQPDSSLSYLPATLFLGTGNFNVEAEGNILLGPVANVFLTPQGVNNSYWYKTYFSTYASSDQVNVTSLGGSITFRENSVTSTDGIVEPMLQLWMEAFTNPSNSGNLAYYQPWLRLAEYDLTDLGSLLSLAPPTLDATALSGNITFQGNYTTMPSPTGTISLVAAKSIDGLTEAGVFSGSQVWVSSQINLSDANPASVPGITSPLSQRSSLSASEQGNYLDEGAKAYFTTGITALFAETGSYYGANGSLETKEALNDTTLLHAGDPVPLQLYAQSGDISGLTLYSAKQADVFAGRDITDIGLYIQNNTVNDISIVSAGRNIIAYDPESPLEILAGGGSSTLQSGDIQINGPGTLEVLAGGNVDLGNNPGSSDPTLNVGITSIGNLRNSALGQLPSADIIVAAGLDLPTGLSSPGGLTLEKFVQTVLLGADGGTYLSELAATMTYSGDPLSGQITAASFAPGSTQLTAEEKAKLELQLFYIVLRDTGRNHNEVGSPGYGNYAAGDQAIQAFFGASDSANSGSEGNVIAWSQDISTINGGNIDILAPSGGLTLASTSSKTTLVAPGIITEGGGGISIYTENDVSIGIGRIFTLKGGDILIWSTEGNIAAGASSKTVQSAPPTQVVIDPQGGNVETDLGGLATGGGIGVLASVEGVPPGNVDLDAPSGVIDAGDAGIRSTGNINLAATKVLNADNITAAGTTTGAPPAPPPPAAPNIGGATAASAAAAANNAAAMTASTNNAGAPVTEEAPSIISVEVLGYGGGDDDSASPSAPPTTSTDSKTSPQAAL